MKMFDYTGRQGDCYGFLSGQELSKDQDQNTFTGMYK